MILAVGAVQPPGAPGPAQLQLDHRALGRVPGRALRGGADRRGRHRGQPVPRGRRSPSATHGPVPRVHAGRVPGRYKEAVDQGLLKIISKMGIDHQQLSRRLQLRGDRSVTIVRRVLPGLNTRVSGIGHTGSRRRRWRVPAGLRRGQSAVADRRASIATPRRRAARPRGPGDPSAAVRGRDRLYAGAEDTEMVYHAVGAIRDLLGSIAAARPVPDEEVERSPRSASASSRRHVARRAQPGGARDPDHRREPDRRQVRQRRRRRRQGTLLSATNGDNANSPIKQVASGRFGVTAEYLNACRELEIKIAQGASPARAASCPAPR